MKSAYLFWTWKPPMWPTSFYNVQKLSSQDQDLRFIYLVWIPSRLFSRLYQGFPSKVQMNSHKCVLNLKLHWVTNPTYHSRSMPTSLQPTILVRCLPFPSTIPSHQSHQKFSTAIVNCTTTILRLSTINRRAGFIKNPSRIKKKHTESWNEDLLLSNFQVLFLTAVSHYGLIIFNT